MLLFKKLDGSEFIMLLNNQNIVFFFSGEFNPVGCLLAASPPDLELDLVTSLVQDAVSAMSSNLL